MPKFKIGIIGAGSIVETNHIPAINALPNAKVGWIYDKDAARMTLVSKMYGIPSLLHALPADGLPEVDVCLLAIPYGSRKPYIEDCRQKGKLLVVEKPFAFSKEEHLANCMGFRPWEIGVNFQRRYYHSVGAIRKIIQGNVFGRLKHIRFVQGNFTLKGGSGYLSNVALAGGGVIAESCSHILDIILSLTDADEVRVVQLQSLHQAGLDYDTVFDSEIKAGNNEVTVCCEISTLRNLDNGLYLEFEHATLSCDLSPDGKTFIRDTKKKQVEFVVTESPLYEGLSLQATRIGDAFLVFWRQFLLGIEQQKANQTSASSSLLTSSWIGDIYGKINLS
jgi:predicted dehydrogenase